MKRLLIFIGLIALTAFALIFGPFDKQRVRPKTKDFQSEQFQKVESDVKSAPADPRVSCRPQEQAHGPLSCDLKFVDKIFGLRTGEATLKSVRKEGWDSRYDFGTDLHGPRGLRSETDAQMGFDWKPNMLVVNTTRSSANTISDLGEKTFDDLQVEDMQIGSTGESLAVTGHLYLVHFADRSDFFVLVYVNEVRPEEYCRIKWARLDGLGVATGGLDLDAALKVKKALENFDPSPVLAGNEIVLQLKAGSTGGNPSRISMVGVKSVYVDEVRTAPLEFESPMPQDPDSIAYFKGGRIPDGQIFVVRHIEYSGLAAGDSNGHGEFILKLKDQTLEHKQNERQPFSGEWNGELVLGPGDEESVVAEVANSSWADVRIYGRLKPN